jgi:NAD(P)-dependent dehydrogenase (short-subunit alcohol dehydrogenase family)
MARSVRSSRFTCHGQVGQIITLEPDIDAQAARQVGEVLERGRHPGERHPGKPGRDAVSATMLCHALTPRLGRPEDIAALVVFLASDESAFITGQNICADGGMLAHQPYVADFREA